MCAALSSTATPGLPDALSCAVPGRAVTPPTLSGHCAVYGNVSGDVRLTGSTVIISGEEIYNDTLDTLVISGQNRSVIRHPARDELAPQIPEPQQEKKQRKEVER